jgi:hypothetical protein
MARTGSTAEAAKAVRSSGLEMALAAARTSSERRRTCGSTSLRCQNTCWRSNWRSSSLGSATPCHLQGQGGGRDGLSRDGRQHHSGPFRPPRQVEGADPTSPFKARGVNRASRPGVDSCRASSPAKRHGAANPDRQPSHPQKPWTLVAQPWTLVARGKTQCHAKSKVCWVVPWTLAAQARRARVLTIARRGKSPRRHMG